MPEATREHRPRVVVLAPSPLLTVTVEAGGAGDEIHLHPGGQGVWVARLAASLGVEVVLCSSFGGESGTVIRSLLEQWDIDVRAVPAKGSNGAYVHDRRSGERRPLAEMDATGRTRHEVDELYGTVLVAGLDSDVVVLGGPEKAGMARADTPDLLPLDTYTRLARDLRRNGATVIADLCGPPLAAALEGGLDLLKLSDEELLVTGEVEETTRPAVFEAADRMVERGAAGVVVTRGDQPTLAVLERRRYEVRGPSIDPVDQRGAGDSVTAGIAAALARRDRIHQAVRVGTAAGTLNVTRRGLASGSRREIELLVPHIEVVEVDR